jgi:Na+/glutamate symporter
MLKKVKRWIAIILTTSTVFMSLLAILAIWDVFEDDVAFKAVGTLGVVLAASAISLVVIRIIEDKDGNHLN